MKGLQRTRRGVKSVLLHHLPACRPETRLLSADSAKRTQTWFIAFRKRSVRETSRLLWDKIHDTMAGLNSKCHVQSLRAWVRSYMVNMAETLDGTSFSITERNRYRMSASCAQEYSVLCILFGCWLPAILRPQEDK